MPHDVLKPRTQPLWDRCVAILGRFKLVLAGLVGATTATLGLALQADAFAGVVDSWRSWPTIVIHVENKLGSNDQGAPQSAKVNVSGTLFVEPPADSAEQRIPVNYVIEGQAVEPFVVVPPEGKRLQLLMTPATDLGHLRKRLSNTTDFINVALQPHDDNIAIIGHARCRFSREALRTKEFVVTVIDSKYADLLQDQVDKAVRSANTLLGDMQSHLDLKDAFEWSDTEAETVRTQKDQLRLCVEKAEGSETTSQPQVLRELETLLEKGWSKPRLAINLTVTTPLRGGTYVDQVTAQFLKRVPDKCKATLVNMTNPPTPLRETGAMSLQSNSATGSYSLIAQGYPDTATLNYYLTGIQSWRVDVWYEGHKLTQVINATRVIQ